MLEPEPVSFVLCSGALPVGLVASDHLLPYLNSRNRVCRQAGWQSAFTISRVISCILSCVISCVISAHETEFVDKQVGDQPPVVPRFNDI